MMSEHIYTCRSKCKSATQSVFISCQLHLSKTRTAISLRLGNIGGYPANTLPGTDLKELQWPTCRLEIDRAKP